MFFVTKFAVFFLSIVILKVSMVIIPNESKFSRVPNLSKISIVQLDYQKDSRFFLTEFFMQFGRVPEQAMLILQRPRIASTEKRILQVVPFGFERVRLPLFKGSAYNSRSLRVNVPSRSFTAVSKRDLYHWRVIILEAFRRNLRNSQIWRFPNVESLLGNLCTPASLMNRVPHRVPLLTVNQGLKDYGHEDQGIQEAGHEEANPIPSALYVEISTQEGDDTQNHQSKHNDKHKPSTRSYCAGL